MLIYLYYVQFTCGLNKEKIKDIDKGRVKDEKVVKFGGSSLADAKQLRGCR